MEDFVTFLDASVTPWHTVKEVIDRLEKSKFKELKEHDIWAVKAGERYYIKREGAISAFVMPKKMPEEATILAAHTDSPGLKLKPAAEVVKDYALMLGVEIYGAPLLTSWLNRDLGIAGRVVYRDGRKQIQEKLVRLEQSPLVIPQLAIHLDKEVNEKGLVLNKQEHLNALAAIEPGKKEKHYLEHILRKEFTFKELLAYDLFLYPLEKARFLGENRSLLASARLDNLMSVHAALSAFLTHLKPELNKIKMVLFLNHEEIGSSSNEGAASPFLGHILERILLSCKGGREHFLRFIARSLCLSIDLAHGVHPNYEEKHDLSRQPRLGRGIVFKTSAQQKYAGHAMTVAPLVALAKDLKIPHQSFVNRNDLPGAGSTIGPIQSTQLGIRTVDLGCAQLSMHACREVMATRDYQDLKRFLNAALLT